MRVYARHQKDVITAYENLRDYREIAEAQGTIRATSPLARLTEARHALQSALMPQEGAHHYQQPARRQRDILRAAEEISRAAHGFAQADITGHNVAVDLTGESHDPSLTSQAAIDDRMKQIAGGLIKPGPANQDFLDQRLMTHVSEAIDAISKVERSHDHNGTGATTQALAILAAGRVMAIAYTQEAKHEGASLSARHDQDEFAQIRPQPSASMRPTADGPSTRAMP